jgi:predicted ATP-grasp superfamily ATP-dependent carboligase
MQKVDQKMIRAALGETPPPAVIVGMNVGGLGVVRALGAAGISSIGVDDTDLRAEHRSRYCRFHPVETIRTADLVDSLVSLGKSLGNKPPLIPTQRLPSRVVSEARDELSPFYRLVLSDESLVDDAENKDALVRLAAGTNARLPKTVTVHAGNLPVESVSALEYPCIIKPADNMPGYGALFENAYKVESSDAAFEILEKIGDAGYDCVIQEWIEGGAQDLFFCLQYRDRQGELKASFSGRKLRIWPSNYGSSSACTIARQEYAELEDMTSEFLQAVGHIGLGSVEYKRDTRTRNWFMIEPTVARTDQLEEVAFLHGVNIPLIAYLDHLELADEFSAIMNPSPDPDDVVWRLQPQDKWAIAKHGRGEAETPNMQSVDAYWRFNDPAPGISRVLSRVFAAVKNR